MGGLLGRESASHEARVDPPVCGVEAAASSRLAVTRPIFGEFCATTLAGAWWRVERRRFVGCVPSSPFGRQEGVRVRDVLGGLRADADLDPLLRLHRVERAPCAAEDLLSQPIGQGPLRLPRSTTTTQSLLMALRAAGIRTSSRNASPEFSPRLRYRGPGVLLNTVPMSMWMASW